MLCVTVCQHEISSTSLSRLMHNVLLSVDDLWPDYKCPSFHLSFSFSHTHSVCSTGQCGLRCNLCEEGRGLCLTAGDSAVDLLTISLELGQPCSITILMLFHCKWPAPFALSVLYTTLPPLNMHRSSLQREQPVVFSFSLHKQILKCRGKNLSCLSVT